MGISDRRRVDDMTYVIQHEFPIWTIISKASFESGRSSWSYVANILKEPVPFLDVSFRVRA
ncbi:hypothetical protein YWY31_06530 [Paenibacillus illinoisensis]